MTLRINNICFVTPVIIVKYTLSVSEYHKKFPSARSRLYRPKNGGGKTLDEWHQTPPDAWSP